MNINSQFVGISLKPCRVKIHWRDTMNYAAAIEDNNPLYFDDEREEGIIAPPMFAVAATWPVIGNLSDFIETTDFPREILLTQVHYTEHIRFYRPVRPGAEWSTEGSMTIPMMGDLVTKVKRNLESVEGGVAKIKVEGTIEVNEGDEPAEPSEANPMAGMVKLSEGKIEGRSEFDNKRGLLKKRTVTITMVMAMMGQKIPTKQEETRELVEFKAAE